MIRKMKAGWNERLVKKRKTQKVRNSEFEMEPEVGTLQRSTYRLADSDLTMLQLETAPEDVEEVSIDLLN